MGFLEVATMACLGGFTSFLANKGISIFGEELRSLVPESLANRLNKKELTTKAVAFSLGLIITLAVPISIISSILLIHTVLLGTDIIGCWTKRNDISAIILGAAWGVFCLYGLEMIGTFLSGLVVDVTAVFNIVRQPILVIGPIFLVLVMVTIISMKKAITWFAIIIMLDHLVIKNQPWYSEKGNVFVLAVGFLLIIKQISKNKADENNNNLSTTLLTLHVDKLKRLRKNCFLLALSGGIISLATYLGLVGGDLSSLVLLAESNLPKAAIIALFRSVSSIHLVSIIAITTGIYTPIGTGFIFVVGIISNSPLLAFILGFVTIIVEILMLEKIVKLMDTYPDFKTISETIRLSMDKGFALTMIVGAMLAANQIMPSYGFLIVGMVYLLNEKAKKALMPTAIGPVAFFLVAIILNGLAFLGIYF